MNWKKLTGSPWFSRCLCIFLIIAMVLTLLLPGAMPTRATPENPVQDPQLTDPEHLHLGQQQSAESSPSPDDPQDSTEPEEGDPDNTGTETEDTTPPDNQTEPPAETLPEDPGTGDGDEGQEDGNQGGDDGAEAQPDLSAVLTWYKYGSEPKTILCGSSEAVSKSMNTAQLVDSELKYAFSLTGDDRDYVTITGISLTSGDSLPENIPQNGCIAVTVPEGGQRDYTFTLQALLKKNGAEQEITFTFVLHCSWSLDLEMEFLWEKTPEGTGKITCTAEKASTRTIYSSDLSENTLAYTTVLTGALSGQAQIRSATFTTASGGSGELSPNGGTLILKVPDGSDRETYYLSFEVLLTQEDGSYQSLFYRITLDFAQVPDVTVNFTWLEGGTIPKTLLCRSGGQVSQELRSNQLSAGAVKYEITLTGGDSASARILNISYTSDSGESGALPSSGALPIALPEGMGANCYRISLLILAGGQQLTYEIRLRYAMDIRLEMQFAVLEDGQSCSRYVICENGRTKTAEAVYDDQLPEGLLSYEMKIAGADSAAITSVTCYQSGSGRTVNLPESGSIALLLKGGKSGENTFTITARDGSGTVYTFRVNIPYKHRGENTVKITTNMTDHQVIINETNTNLSVRAWSEDQNGNLLGYIPANGVDTLLIVTLDGEQLRYASSSGPASEYILFPENPEVGDTNTHILRIYAEDAYGNYGELVLTLRGQRNQAGQKKGTATIYVDLTTMGLGIVASVPYDVLADESVSYVVAKAILGMDTGDPFGSAEEALGWKGRYSGTLDTGFYLQSLTPGITPNTLEGESWGQYGSTEEEILSSIDRQFGRGTGLATLWRCIYRNGLNKSSGTEGTFGEFDYTSGSGWIFSLNGTYYPGLSMSEYALEDGDVLTLRFTLAYGWDVGGGTAGYGNTAGYCVTALNGSYTINHRMEAIENADGSISYVCKCCGLREECAHEGAIFRDLGDGTHISYCPDCKETIGDPQNHNWEAGEETHRCTDCGAEEAHLWKEVAGSNTATCTEPGTHTVACVYCPAVREEPSSPEGHALNNRWNHAKTEHYQKCSRCGETIAESVGSHRYVYHAGDDDWYCAVCDAGHDWDYCGNGHLTLQNATCRKLTYFCSQCGLFFIREGEFPEYHSYANGVCVHCGQPDPGWLPPEADTPDHKKEKKKTGRKSA